MFEKDLHIPCNGHSLLAGPLKRASYMNAYAVLLLALQYEIYMLVHRENIDIKVNLWHISTHSNENENETEQCTKQTNK